MRILNEMRYVLYVYVRSVCKAAGCLSSLKSSMIPSVSLHHNTTILYAKPIKYHDCNVRPVANWRLQGSSSVLFKPRFIYKALRVKAVNQVSPTAERLRLQNLSPTKGSRKDRIRKGRGRAAGQGGSCGFGMRGQKSRSGRGTRPGFQGGSLPLYRRLPKLKGMRGEGMKAGTAKFLVVNISQLTSYYSPHDIVTMQTLKEKGVIQKSGKSTKLPLKVLGKGSIIMPLTVYARQFSLSARKKITEAGGKVINLIQKSNTNYSI